MAEGSDRFVFQALWVGVAQIFQLALTFLGFVILVRIIGVEAYGVFAVTLVCVGLAEIFVGSHVADGVVSARDLRATHTNALFWILVGLGSVASAALWFGQEVIAALFSMPEAAAVLGAIALLPALRALSSVPGKLLERDVKLSAVSINSGLAAAAATLAGIVAAFQDAGVMSLVIMEYTRATLTLLLNLLAAKWRPSFSFDGADTREILDPTLGWIRSHAVKFLAMNAIPRGVIGAALGPEALGLYVICKRLLDQVNSVLSGPVSAVVLPMSALNRDDDARQRLFLKIAIRSSAMIYFPALLGIILVAPVLVPVLFGDVAGETVWVLQLLCLVSLRTPLTGFANAYFAGRGEHPTVFRLQATSLIVGSACQLIGVQFGLLGACAALVCRHWLMWPLIARALSQRSGYEVVGQLTTLLSGAVPALGMALLVYLASQATPTGFSDAAQLGTLVGIGALTYPLLLLAFSKDARAAIPSCLAHAAKGEIHAAIRELATIFVGRSNRSLRADG